MKYIVYQTTNTKNNKIYIGVHKTKDPEIFDGYLGCGIKITNPSSYMNPTTPLQFAVKKYGGKIFHRTILNILNTAEEAFELEKKLVTNDFINRKDTYNAKVGGYGGASLYTPIYQYSINGDFLKKWNSITEASDFYSISDTALHNASKYKGSSNNFFWNINKEPINIREYTYSVGQLCYQYNSEGKYTTTYNSWPEAAKDNNVPLQSIQRAIKGGYKVQDFYYSKHLVELFIVPPKISLRKNPLFVYTLSGEFIIKLTGSKEICNYFNIKTTSSITTALRTKRQYKNFQLSLVFEDKLKPLLDKRNIKKSVGQYTLTGDLVNTFESITKACEVFGTGVQKVLKGQQQQCKNFIFRYLD